MLGAGGSTEGKGGLWRCVCGPVEVHALAWLAGVLTKIDIMDPGTNCRDVLEGQTYQLRNGWIGVVNRGQADINSRVRRGGRRLGEGRERWG